MEEKIIARASELFIKLGFKSITMDDIAADMGISKKTIYKFFINKEVLIEECTDAMHKKLRHMMRAVLDLNHDPICENFEIKKMFSGFFQNAETSPLYQLKKHYPDIHAKVMCIEKTECTDFIRQNIIRGIEMGFYREDTDIENSVHFYYTLIFHINENTILEKDAQKLEFAVLEYHTRAIATEKGILELEKHIANLNISINQ